MNEELKKLFEKQHYALVGKHTAVKTCHWTKQSIRGKGVCYKQKFYGIQSHRCLQMTPIVDRCNFNCLFCWRPMDYTEPQPPEDFDDPKYIVEESIKAQRKLLIGFKGSATADLKKLEEALSPNQVAISLAGEPTIYPKLGELIEEYAKRGFTTFLVTNGSNPDVLEKLNPKPTQLYISVSAPTKEMHLKINRPLIKDGWERLQRSLELMSKMNCRTVVRLTLTRSAMIMPEKYAEMIKKANPMFVEAKAYMHVGPSAKRLPEEEMPTHAEVLEFAKTIADLSGYIYRDESVPSRVVLLTRSDINNTKIKA